MRISVNKNDPGFVPDPYMYTVFLNDERLHGCVMADEEKGEVMTLLGGPSRHEVFTGKVRIVRDADDTK